MMANSVDCSAQFMEKNIFKEVSDIRVSKNGTSIKKNYKRIHDWLIEWRFTPLLTVFQSYHGDTSHYSCFPGFHQY